MLDFIVAYKRTHDGNSPTVREICDACAISSTGVGNYCLVRLVQHGLLRVDNYGRSRSIEVVGGEWTYQAPVASEEIP